MLPDTFYDGYGSGYLSAWWFRWHNACKPGFWVVRRNSAGFFWHESNIDAVIDDFGNLVRVSS